MTPRNPRLVLAVSAVLALAACGGGAKPSASATLSPSAPVTSATDSPSDSASPFTADSSAATAPAGTTGAAPGTSAAAPKTSTAAAAIPPQWVGYHGDGSRSGFAATTPKPTALTVGWQAKLDGQVYASPLVVGNLVVAATEAGSLYGLDPTTGKTVWTNHLHDAGTESTKPCGNIDPQGITGTPVADPATGVVYAVVEQGTSSARSHWLYAVNGSTGALVWSKQVDAPGSDNAAMQERGALVVANGRVYVPFGGRSGDCGDYHGSVVALPLDGNGALLSYVVPTQREAGIWTPPGPTLAPDGTMYVAVGNGESDSSNNDAYDSSDSVLHLSATLTLLDSFSPSTWANDNAKDLDLGSAGPTLLPNGVVYADGKSSTGYTVSAAHLGGIGGQLKTAQVCASFGGTAFSGNTVYVPCTSGVKQLTIASDGTITTGWSAKVGGAPVLGTGSVFTLDASGGVLQAYDSATGASLASVKVGTTSRFATPALSGTWAYVPTLTGITAVAGA